ncbi:MAG: hypothetical protein ACI861_001972 [Paracoccaceae bacterium]|jgi:hypothetical protein
MQLGLALAGPFWFISPDPHGIYANGQRMHKNPSFPSMADLQAAVPDILAAPKDAALVQMLCFRHDYGQRDFVNQIELTPESGILGERWGKAPWLKLEDGTPDPRIQVSILGRRVLDLVWPNQANTPHPGDTFIADMDFSEANMPVGTELCVGNVLLRVSSKFNDACVKWRTRYGDDAKDWIVRPDNIKHRLRGVLCEIVQGGTIKLNDQLRKQ